MCIIQFKWQYKKLWPILCTYRQCQLYKNYHLSDSNSEMSPTGRCIPSLKMLKYEIRVLETMKYSPFHRREYTCSPAQFEGFHLYFCHFCQKSLLLTVHTDYTVYSWFYLQDSLNLPVHLLQFLYHLSRQQERLVIFPMPC